MKIWFDKNSVDFNKFCSEQFLILPFFDDNIIQKDNDFKNSKKWKDKIQKTISLVSKEDCDVFVFPEKLNDRIENYISEAKKANKKVLAFYNDDNDKPSCLDSCVKLYRTSILKTKQKDNEFAMPAWSQDFADIAPLTIRSKGDKPVVGFCGVYSNSLRKNCIDALNKNNNIKANFIIRQAFWGGAVHSEQVRKEYVSNILNSDLILCVRGAGNFSYRLYEVLSCGRIPIFVNTDCVLPCEDKIDWKKICIFVDSAYDINERINRFWHTLSCSEYKDMQINARNTYESFLSPDGFAQYISYNI